jgi:hypothetical protein
MPGDLVLSGAADANEDGIVMCAEDDKEVGRMAPA